jgi:CTP:molybdopterin cytidylyltransferase MocA
VSFSGDIHPIAGGSAPTIAGIVLAAGGGSRFDGPDHKLVAPFRGRPVVAWVLEAAAEAAFHQLFVVTGAVDLDHLLPPGATVVPNPAWSEGQATSVAAGLDAAAVAGSCVAVIGLGDQPLVPASAWRAVAAADEAPIAVATFAGRRRPPVRLHRSVWPLVPRAGDEGARALFRETDLVSEVACSGNPVDIDTVEDLRQWS